MSTDTKITDSSDYPIPPRGLAFVRKTTYPLSRLMKYEDFQFEFRIFSKFNVGSIRKTTVFLCMKLKEAYNYKGLHN